MADHIKELNQFLKAYEAASNSHDFDKVAPLVAEDAVYWMSDGSFDGLAAIRAAFERTWASLNNDHYEIRDVAWIAVSESSAACTYQFHWSSEVDGQPIEGHGRGTSVLTRRAGRWQVLHEHLSVPRS